MDQFKQLVNEAKNGNKEAFKEIFEGLNKRLFSYAFSRTLNRDDALDIVQETFIELWDSLEKFKYRSNEEFQGFVFTLAKRKLFRFYNTKDKTVPLDEKIIDGAGGYEMEIDNHQYLFNQINSLSPNYQDVLRLRYWSGMTFSEIASFLRVKETTAKVWHHRAIQKLKILLANYETI